MLLAWMPILFFVVALFYSAVGFGGGSSYLAILALTGKPLDQVATLALICNLTATSLGTYHFAKAGQLPLGKAWPFLVGSIPAAFIGGLITLAGSTHLFLLAASLTVAGFDIFRGVRNEPTRKPLSFSRRVQWMGGIGIGAFLGLLSVMVGIGGGIFLAPILYAIGWASARQIAGICAFFILLNSLSGLAGRWTRLGNVLWTDQTLLLLMMVFAGAFLGSRLSSIKLSPILFRSITGVLVLIVSIRLWVRWFDGI